VPATTTTNDSRCIDVIRTWFKDIRQGQVAWVVSESCLDFLGRNVRRPVWPRPESLDPQMTADGHCGQHDITRQLGAIAVQRNDIDEHATTVSSRWLKQRHCRPR
jgi:hypothetical protein